MRGDGDPDSLSIDASNICGAQGYGTDLIPSTGNWRRLLTILLGGTVKRASMLRSWPAPKLDACLQYGKTIADYAATDVSNRSRQRRLDSQPARLASENELVVVRIKRSPSACSACPKAKNTDTHVANAPAAGARLLDFPALEPCIVFGQERRGAVA